MLMNRYSKPWKTSIIDYMNPIDQLRDGKTQNQSDSQRIEHLHRSQTQRISAFDSEGPWSGTFLEPEEIVDLTGRVRRSAQVRALRSMGIEHRVRPDGSVAILRTHIDKVFEASDEPVARSNKRQAHPNWLEI